MSVIWPGLDLIAETHDIRQQEKRVRYTYPFSTYPFLRGSIIGTYDTQSMNQIIALWNALRTKSTIGGRVQMTAIQVRAAIFAIRVNQGRWRRHNYDVRRHNLRHSLGTFLAANEINLPVIQSMLRHAKPSTTSIYTHRVNSAQMAAQEKFLAAIKMTSAAG